MVARLLNELLEISQPNINKGKNVGFDIFHSLTSLRGLSVFKVQTTQSRNQSVSDQAVSQSASTVAACQLSVFRRIEGTNGNLYLSALKLKLQ